MAIKKIKSDDLVKVMKGKDRGKTGKIIQVFPDVGLVVVEGLNIRYKHLRSRGKGKPGQKVQFSAPMHVDNVQLVCPKCQKDTRVGFKLLEQSNKVRICKKCKEII